MSDPSGSTVFTCVTELERRDGVPIAPAFLTACTGEGVAVGAHAEHCPDNCGGHVLCAPCLAVARASGLLRP